MNDILFFVLVAKELQFTFKNRNRKLEASLPKEKERLQNPFTKQAEAEIRKLACELCP